MENKETLYARWFSGELTDEELAVLKKEGAISDLERIEKITEQWRMPSYDTSTGYAKYKSKQAGGAKVKKLNWRWATGIAASFLVLFLAYNFLSDDRAVLAAKHGVNESIALADGSSILVNDGSEIRFDEENWATNRSIELTGEAFFKVEKGSEFVVNTGNGSVTVLGTSFNVRAWGDNLYVECYEGRVQVKAKDGESILNKKESVNVVFGQMEEKQQISHITPQWSEGISKFYEESINEVFAEVERQYDVKIRAPKLNRKFSGAFMHNNLEKAIFDICKPVGLKFNISDNKKEILIE